MVFPVGKAVTLTVKPLGAHVALNGEYRVSVHRLNAGGIGEAFTAWNKTEYTLTPDADGCLRFEYTAQAESEYFIRVCKEDRRLAQLSVYALDADLACRRPYRGDLHMHTCRSDGKEAPAVVCANYRKKGYDFIVITDHYRYYPSLEAMKAFAEVKPALNILPGEEVHLPQTDVHIVNAGGVFSVNGILESSLNYKDTKGELSGRRFDETVTPPALLDDDAYNREIDAIEQALADCPENVNSRS